MLSSEMLYQYTVLWFYEYCDGDEASMEGSKYAVEVGLCLYGLFQRISSHSNNLTVSRHLLVCSGNLRASAG